MFTRNVYTFYVHKHKHIKCISACNLISTDMPMLLGGVLIMQKLIA